MSKNAPVQRKRVPMVEAKARLIDATIALCREECFRNVSVRKIAKRADLNQQSVLRAFGSMEELFAAVTKELADRFAHRLTEYDDLSVLLDADVILRTRLIAWLLGEGVNPQLIMDSSQSRTIQGHQDRLADHVSVEPKTARLFRELMQFTIEGFATFREVHREISNEDVVDALLMIADIRSHLTAVEERLGWGQSTKTV